jgi:hypothetical protein
VDLRGFAPPDTPKALTGGLDEVISEELIGTTVPNGTIDIGEWDVVEDVCQDGIFDSTDSIHPTGFIVDILNDILNGEQAGNFGWLTWTGNTSTPTLIDSLTMPGDSHTYINPHDAADNFLSVGDWVEGKPGVSNAKGVLDALDMLSYVEIQVPIWDVSQGNGANTIYHITGFATIRILDYDLPGHDQITAEFIGFADCDG